MSDPKPDLKDFFKADDYPSQRSGSYTKFIEKHGAEHKAWNEARDAFWALDKNGDAKYGELHSAYETAHQALGANVAKSDKGIYVVAESVKDDAARKAAAEAIEKFYEKRSKLQSYLRGTEVDGAKASEALKNAFATAEKAESGVVKVMDGYFGHLNLHGWKETLNQNLNVFDETVTKGHKTAVFGRVGGVAAGSVILGHAVCKGKTSDDEPRSVLFRLLEGLVGTSLIAGSALAGRAR